MGVANVTFGLIGALSAFPFRLAAREVRRQGGVIRRGVSRRTQTIVFGRQMLERSSAKAIEAQFDAAGKRIAIGECSFLRALGLLDPAGEHASLTRLAMHEQSNLPLRVIDLLSLFDAFEQDHEPFSFRDLILARKYAALINEGVDWLAIARSVHRSGAGPELTRLSLGADQRSGIYVRTPQGPSELNGQLRLPMPSKEDIDLDVLFSEAEAAEADGNFVGAIAAYQQCLKFDPGDAVTAFNLGNCLRESGNKAEAERSYLKAVKADPTFVEAWFNVGGLLREQGKIDRARQYLIKAVDFDATYADPLFNLASLEFDSGNFSEAKRWWKRYLDLDQHSEWAQTARRGVQFVDLQEQAKARAR